MTHSIASGTAHAVSHKLHISFLKNCSKSILQSQNFISQGQTDILAGNTGYSLYSSGQGRYKNWPLLNMVKTNVILYISCTTAVYLQLLIPTGCTMFIYSSHIFQPQFLAIFVELVLLCAVYVNIFGNSLHHI